MIENTKCECGHQNPVGTVLCESCGLPLDEQLKQSSEPLEMRYDGAARRSQKANPTFIDRIWNFFSSVKVAIWLILITLVASMIGTIFTQENAFVSFDPTTFYEEKYGWIGKVYYELGLSHTYESWWFITLLVMIGTSLVVCSLDRVLPLYRALNKQQIRKHEQFLRRQRTVYEGTWSVKESDERTWLNVVVQSLAKKGYKVTRDGAALLAEKNRFSRWGPYINHIGLIVFLLAVLLRTIPGWSMDSYVAVREGETKQIPQTDYYIKNEKFTLDLYKDKELPASLKGTSRAKLYKTDAVLYKCVANCDNPAVEPTLEEVTRQGIIVNKPLSYQGLHIYQFGYDNALKIAAVNPVIIDKATGQKYGPFHLSMRDPELNYTVGPYTLELKAKYLDFALDDNGKPRTKSDEPNAPAFIFVVKGPGLAANGEPYLYFPKQNDKLTYSQDAINGELANKIDIRVPSMSGVTFAGILSTLNVRIEYAMPYIWTGAAIWIFGVFLGSYWQHRRIWLRLDGQTVLIGAHTNKNFHGIRADVAFALQQSGIDVDPNSLDHGGNRS